MRVGHCLQNGVPLKRQLTKSVEGFAEPVQQPMQRSGEQGFVPDVRQRARIESHYAGIIRPRTLEVKFLTHKGLVIRIECDVVKGTYIFLTKSVLEVRNLAVVYAHQLGHYIVNVEQIVADDDPPQLQHISTHGAT